MKTLTCVHALLFAVMLGASHAVFAADASGAKNARQTLEEGCKANGGTWTSHGRQGGSCSVTSEPAAKKKKKKQTLEQWCKDHGGTWTSDGHQGGSCAL